MVVLQRIATLEAFINAGHNVVVSYCNSAATRRIKVKVTVDAEPNAVPAAARPLLMAALHPLRANLLEHVVVDRGHKFSNGKAFACFWIQHHTTVDAEPKTQASDAAVVEEHLDHVLVSDDARNGSSAKSPDMTMDTPPDISQAVNDAAVSAVSNIEVVFSPGAFVPDAAGTLHEIPSTTLPDLPVDVSPKDV